ncbi:MAG: SDR family oxidoreductase [Nitrospirae bacterium]|nr:SDR family oxidoreductase [Magnetococcales bacterium]HAT50480.1 NAD(P)-dependent oxidoreductase [Alphaproteobacteria bacterium]
MISAATQSNPMSCDGRLILVTGASSGIGRATAVLLSRLGARLLLVGRSQEKLEQTLAALDGTGHRIEPFDLNETEEIPAWFKHLIAESGPLSGLVQCAGVQHYTPARFITVDKINRMMKVNVFSTTMLAKCCAGKGAVLPGGSLVFIASVAGLVGDAGLSVYAASKGAVIALTKSLALEFAPAKIRVNAVAPGCVETDMLDKMRLNLTADQVQALAAKHPLGFGTAEDVAHAVAFLLADTGRWITGSVLTVDGGYTA